jgi:alkanesulfonate monooxygenase SsuD/methylene tetrahydromethanopterin reductase-like flavin-dependent oxidoreductase (luciferase family)
VAGQGTFISVGKSLDQAIERVRQAEAHGYDSAYVTHIAARDSISVLMAYAAATERIKVGSGVLPIYSRTPVATAQQAATVDEYSGGRMVLGLGVSHQPTVEHWYQAKLERPVTAMREYVAILQALFAGQNPPEGEIFSTNFRFMGYEPRPDLPIYIAALSPRMLELAGEVADGVILWLCNPEYVRRVVVPAVTRGRERAGRGLEGFDIVAAVPSAVTDDKEGTFAVMRSDLISYFGLPFYRAMIERSGFAEDVAAFDAGMAQGDLDVAMRGISEDFLDALTAVGSADEVRSGVGRYAAAGVTSPCIGPIPRTDFAATLAAAAP